MSEYTDVLERARRTFGAPDLPLDRVLRRSERRRRNRRIGTIVVALAIAGVAMGGALRVLNRSLEEQPAERRITPDNVQSLRSAWNAKLEGGAAAIEFRTFDPNVVQTFAPTVADGKVFVATNAGKLYAFDTGCGTRGATCAPLWVADAAAAVGARPGVALPISNPPLVADGLVLVSSFGGHLLAFPEDCGTDGARCSPLWVGETGDAIDPPVVSNGLVYGIDGRHGVVYAFPENCGTGGVTCRPMWTARTEPYHASSHAASLFLWRLAVSDGIVFAVGASDHPDRLYAFDAATGRRLWIARSLEPPHGGAGQAATTPVVTDGYVLVSFQTLYAYPVRCRTDGGTCDPAWILPGGTAPVVSGGTAYFSTFTDYQRAGEISAVDVDCGVGGSECRPLWSVPTDTGFGEFAVGDGMLFAVSQFGKTTLEAFPATCPEPPCMPSWRSGNLGRPRFAPVVSDGVVYVATQEGRVFAFRTDCGSGGAMCEPLWQGAGTSPPAIEGTTVFTASANGRLHAFELPPEAAAIAAPTTPGTTRTVLLTLLLVITAAVVVGSARRRSSR